MEAKTDYGFVFPLTLAAFTVFAVYVGVTSACAAEDAVLVGPGAAAGKPGSDIDVGGGDLLGALADLVRWIPEALGTLFTLWLWRRGARYKGVALGTGKGADMAWCAGKRNRLEAAARDRADRDTVRVENAKAKRAAKAKAKPAS